MQIPKTLIITLFLWLPTLLLASNTTVQLDLARVSSSQWQQLDPKKLALRSKSALIEDAAGNTIFNRLADTPMPIASITKLMMAMVVLDAQLPLDEKLTITKADRDLVRLTGSRLKYGAVLPRKQLITLALMASENRAASVLGRSFPGGLDAFVVAMNDKAAQLKMQNSHFVDPTGIHAGNQASARDLMRMLKAARAYPLIKKATTMKKLEVTPHPKKGPLTYTNTNRLLKNGAWQVFVGKTGYINDSGRCLVMQARVDNRDINIVLLNSFGKLTPFGDSNRIRRWIQQGI